VNTTYIIDKEIGYGTRPPFNPDKKYPEIGGNIGEGIGDNRIYDILRRIFVYKKMDEANFGTVNWNPFGEFIKPGDRVVLKPNWVTEIRGRKYYQEQLITHPSVIRVVLDYVIIALKGKGDITICDAPMQYSSFSALVKESYLEEILNNYSLPKEISLKYMDLRQEEVELDETRSQIIKRTRLEGDPLGYTEIDLGDKSYLEELCIENTNIRFAVSDYDEEITRTNQRRGIHKYLIPNTILSSDVFINLPKMKTHRRTGITGAMKNLIGINGSKAYLVHYSKGSPNEMGDEYQNYTTMKGIASYVDYKLKPYIPNVIWKIIRYFWMIYKTSVQKKAKSGQSTDLSFMTSNGCWPGNRTIWRTIFDLNMILLLADKSGELKTTRQRKYLGIVDGIVGMEGEGPIKGDPRDTGTIIMGDDPVSLDACMADLMGFDIEKIPSVSNVRNINKKFSFSSYNMKNDYQNVTNDKISRPFNPPMTWKGHLEKNSE